MVEEITRNIYRIQIPIFNTSLEFLNSYVIRSSEKNLIIDTGLNQEDCLIAMQAGLRELGVDIKKTDFFITHVHPDHLALVSQLATDTTTVYFNQPEADLVKSGVQWEDYIGFARLNGFPEDELQLALRSFHGFEFTSNWRLAFHILKDGDTLSVGDNLLRCVETPGHSRGHMCLHESKKKILFSGDHILGDISPGIQLWTDDWNPLKEYLASLDKVNALEIEMILPGHRGIIRNPKERIQELKYHHRKRLGEIISILQKGDKDAFQMCAQMNWDVDCDSWDMFPLLQKWLAVGETLAHLKYLEGKGKIRREIMEQRIVYLLN